MHYLEAVYNTLTECHIKTFPVDCFSILNKYNFRTITYTQLKAKKPEAYELCLSISNDAFMDRVNRIVAYNEKVNIQRIRFSLMHELGHFILQTDSEDAADYYASNILAPRAIMNNLECKNADDVHSVFDISYAAANRAWYDCRHRVWSKYDQAIKEHFFPPAPIPIESPVPQLIDKESQEPKERPKLSPEAEARKQRVLTQIRKKRKKAEKKLKEYEKDMKFLNFSEDEAFDRAERLWLFGNDL